MHFSTLYGPVKSGRLGISLGVDLLGSRICSMNCLYCEVGATRMLTRERGPYMPARTILAELSAWKEEQLPKPEHITLGGLGEPCLNSELQHIITGCREIYPDVPVAILTNSTLLDTAQVRQELCAAQVVLPSLDSLVQSEFLRINRPCKDVGLQAIQQGLLDLRSEFTGHIYLEILLLHGINDSQENLEAQHEFLTRLAPERVDVVTMTRPGPSPLAKAVDAETLSRWQSTLQPLGTLTTVPSGPTSATSATALTDQAAERLILNSLQRRPQTKEQVCSALNLNQDQNARVFSSLLRAGRIQGAHELGAEFYQAT
jgi:wyosine [tRNA(Phe)-imidazoG37] synthetase (radical SAM superfamily)